MLNWKRTIAFQTFKLHILSLFANDLALSTIKKCIEKYHEHHFLIHTVVVVSSSIIADA